MFGVVVVSLFAPFRTNRIKVVMMQKRKEPFRARFRIHFNLTFFVPSLGESLLSMLQSSFTSSTSVWLSLTLASCGHFHCFSTNKKQIKITATQHPFQFITVWNQSETQTYEGTNTHMFSVTQLGYL